MMKRRITAILLAGALILSLAACGGRNDSGGSGQPDSPVTDGAAVPAGPAAPATPAVPDVPGVPDNEPSAPDAAPGDEPSAPTAPDAPIAPDAPGDEPSAPDGPVSTYPVVILPGDPPASADDSAASDGDPAAPGDEPPTSAEKPPAPGEDASAPDGEPPAPGEEPAASADADLSAFYSAVTGKYTFAMPMLADDEILDNFYPSMTGIGAEQRLIYVCGMTPNNGEIGLVQVKDGKDVDAVKNIFKARVNYMVGDGNGPGGAWYPQAMDSWENNSRIVSSGNYVMMVVHESCDDIVKEFNALF